MSVSYRKRGKKNLWDYRIFDKNKKVVASNSGFKTKREAEIEALALELKLINGAIIDKNITFYALWEKWLELTVKPLGKADSTFNKHLLRGKFIKEYFKDKPALKIKASEYQGFINKYAETNCRDNVSRMNAEIRNVIVFAKRDKLNIEDFTEGVIISGRPPKKRRDEKYIHSFDDYQKLVTYLENNLDLTTSIVPYLLLIQQKQECVQERLQVSHGIVCCGKVQKSKLIDDMILLENGGQILKQKNQFVQFLLITIL